MGNATKPNPLTTGILRFISGFLTIAIGANLGLFLDTPTSFAGSSASFQVRDDQINPTQFTQTSAGFTIYGSVEPLVQGLTGTTYNGRVGSPLRVNPTAGGGGGGSANITAPPTTACPVQKDLTLTNIECSRIYKGLIKLTGTKDKNTDYVFINEDLSGTYFANKTSWEKEVLLQIGENTIVVYGKNFCDAKTPPVTIKLTRAIMGDTNDDEKTNDYDLSAFTRRWERKKDCLSDFNRDQITNDYDLSLLASAWSG